MEVIINNNGSLFLVIRQWLDKEYADDLFKNINENVKWYNKSYAKDGKLYKMNREICLLGDGSHFVYPYHKIPFEVSHWDQVLNSEIRKLKDNICNDVNIQTFSEKLEFNSCVVNKYKPEDFIKYHQDIEAHGLMHQVCSISLGVSRIFHIKKINSFETPMKVVLNHGDLLLMMGRSQQDYEHAIHSQKNSTIGIKGPSLTDVGSRISLTYRYI